MTRRSPYVITLSAADRVVLEERARAYSAPFAQVVRAKIVLLAADGEPSTVAPTTGIAPFGELVRRVMTTEPYASARRVFWIVDNGSSHAGAASVARISEAWPTAQLVHLPVHASWLNQIEIVFSVIQRKVIKPADFADLDALTQRLTDFEPRYNATATPFDWRFTRADLTDMLARIDADAHRPLDALPLAA